MRFLTFAFALALMAPVAVHAADNKIIIKSDDGKVTEYEIPEEARNRPVDVQKPEPAPQAKPVATKPAPEPDAASAEDAPQESVVAAPEPAGEKPQAQAASATPEEKPPTESKAAASKEAVKQAPKVTAKAPVPVPGRKPEIVKAAYNMPTDSAIPQSTAVSIAIAHAPPASDFKVLRRMHEGVPVYAVAFKTEEGTHIVLVDARDGAVIAD